MITTEFLLCLSGLLHSSDSFSNCLLNSSDFWFNSLTYIFQFDLLTTHGQTALKFDAIFSIHFSFYFTLAKVFHLVRWPRRWKYYLLINTILTSGHRIDIKSNQNFHAWRTIHRIFIHMQDLNFPPTPANQLFFAPYTVCHIQYVTYCMWYK